MLSFLRNRLLIPLPPPLALPPVLCTTDVLTRRVCTTHTFPTPPPHVHVNNRRFEGNLARIWESETLDDSEVFIVMASENDEMGDVS